MTEEIIIDGVNVWSCKHYDLENNYCDQSYLGEGGLLKNTKNPKRCECSPNCYYKQLKRLEQENKELKKQIESDKGLITVGGKQQYQYLQRIDELEQENKELKHRNENLRIALSTYEMPEVIKVLTDWRTGELQLQEERLNNYRSALDTIQRMILFAWEQGKYLDGGLYNDLINEFNKINEGLQ